MDRSIPGRTKLIGELDLYTAADLIISLATLDGAAMEIDMADVSFMDSSGLRTMVQLSQHHPGLRFVSPSPHVTRALEIAGLSDLVSGERGQPLG